MWKVVCICISKENIVLEHTHCNYVHLYINFVYFSMPHVISDMYCMHDNRKIYMYTVHVHVICTFVHVYTCTCTLSL